MRAKVTVPSGCAFRAAISPTNCLALPIRVMGRLRLLIGSFTFGLSPRPRFGPESGAAVFPGTSEMARLAIAAAFRFGAFQGAKANRR